MGVCFDSRKVTLHSAETFKAFVAMHDSCANGLKNETKFIRLGKMF